MASELKDYIPHFAKVGEFIGVVLVSWFSGTSVRAAIEADEVTPESASLLKRKDAAKELKISVSLLDQWRRQGKITPVKGMGDRIVRYRSDDIEKFKRRKRE